MFIKEYKTNSEKMDSVLCTSAYIIRSRNKKNYNIQRYLERVFHLGMSSRSILNNGKGEPARKAT